MSTKQFESTGQSEGDLPVLRDTSMALPALPAKPGWKTVEAHMALLFTLIAAIAALMGYRNITPEKLQSGYELIMGLVTTVAPLAAAGGVVWNLITSRGKFESNKVNATAAISLAQQGVSGVGLLGGAFKRPGTYIDIARSLGAAGAIPGRAGDVVGQILGGSQGRTRFDDATLGQLFESLVRQMSDLSSAVARIEERSK